MQGSRQRGRVVRALGIWGSRVQVPPWPLAGFVRGSPLFNSSAALVYSQLVCLLPVGILNQLSSFQLLVSLALKSPSGEWSITYVCSKIWSMISRHWKHHWKHQLDYFCIGLPKKGHKCIANLDASRQETVLQLVHLMNSLSDQQDDDSARIASVSTLKGRLTDIVRKIPNTDCIKGVLTQENSKFTWYRISFNRTHGTVILFITVTVDILW